ncbi:MAG: hypothetical protein ACE5NA_00040 [Nitrospiraceae bacterium]
MAETRRGGRDTSALTRSAERDRLSKQPSRSIQFDLYRKTVSEDPRTIAATLRQLMQQLRDVMVVGIRGGSGKLPRWNQRSELVESSLREADGKLSVEIPLELFEELCIVNEEAPREWCWTVNDAGSLELEDRSLLKARLRVDVDGHVLMRGTDSAFGLHQVTETQRNAIPNPVRGMAVFNTTDISIDAYFSDSPAPGSGTWIAVSELPAVFSGTRGAFTQTVISTTNVYVAVTGALTASGSEVLFTLGGAGTNEWTYTGPDRAGNLRIESQGSARKVGGGSPETMQFRWHLNGAPVGMGGRISARQNEPGAWAAIAFVTLSNGDVLQLRVRNTTGVSDVSVAGRSDFGGNW